MSKEVKIILNSMMESTIDTFMNNHDFKRKANSLIYSRTIGKTRQKVDMVFFSHPSYHPGAVAHIYPWLMVYFPEVNKIAREILKDVDTCERSMKVTVRQPIQIGVDSERWMLTEEVDNHLVLAEKIKNFMRTYTIPLLDELKCIEDYIALYENENASIIWDDAFYIFVTSAYVSKGEYVNAKNVFERRFGKLGPRKRYGSAFEYLEKLVDNGDN